MSTANGVERSLARGSASAAAAALALLALAFCAACDGSSNPTTDSRAQPDTGQTADLQSSGGDIGQPDSRQLDARRVEAGQPDGPPATPDARPVDAGKPDGPGPRPDARAPDLWEKDRGTVDTGLCQKSGQDCTKLKCCPGLKCCTGMPIPPGKAICYKICPVSDRNLKHSLQSLSSEQILERLSRLPISSWSYNNEPPGVRHVGPMAQDFKAAFGLGSDERYIAPVDADGVALAAIQALYRQLQQLRREVDRLRAENQRLRSLAPGASPLPAGKQPTCPWHPR
jgi:hypothetical protein